MKESEIILKEIESKKDLPLSELYELWSKHLLAVLKESIKMNQVAIEPLVSSHPKLHDRLKITLPLSG